MNQDIHLFGLLSINDSEYPLGHAAPNQLLIRASQIMQSHKGEALTLTIRMSKTQIISLTSAPEDQERALFESSIASAPPADEVELVPGVTVQQAFDAESSPEGQAYKRICDPEKRIGLSQSIIDEIITAYRSRFPEIWHLYPVWQD